MSNLYNSYVKKFFFPYFDKIIVTSPNIIKTSPVLRDFKDKIEVVPLFVDTSHFYPRKDNVRYKFVDNDEKLILYVGRFGRYKGLEYLIESLRFLPENYKLLLIGKGKKEKELKDLVKKHNFNNRVIFLNHVKYQDLPFYYSAADVFVLPSIDRGEAFGLVALEAMACGIPVITTELGTGTTYHNINGETGIHVPPKNSKEIANAVNTIVSQDWKNKKSDIIINRAKDFDIKVFQKKIKKILEV
nr:glycosyltransferase [Marinitoga sp. 1135]